MQELKSLLENLTALPPDQERRSAPGLAVWLVWRDDLNPVVAQILQDYGGICLSQSFREELWFFVQSDGFLALARLQLWAKLQGLPLSMVVLRAEMGFGVNQSRELRLDPSLAVQALGDPLAFNIWVHPAAAAAAQGLPGIGFEPENAPEGLAAVQWSKLTVDSRLSYQVGAGWYCVLRPLGNPLEKGFQLGWREFFGELENILSRQKFKYTLHNNFLLFPLDSLKHLRSWCTDFFNLVNRLKADDREKYWPCVMVVVDKRGLNFNNELPGKIPVDWDQLMPDFPIMTFRNGYLLGSDFQTHEVRFAAPRGVMEDWCSISPALEDGANAGAIPVDIAVHLVSGRQGQCFYCGLRTHEPAQCPSRLLKDWSPASWKKLATMDFSAINTAFRDINQAMDQDGDEGLTQLLLNGEGSGAVLARAVFDIGAVAQHHMMRRVWLTSSKDPAAGFGHPNPQDDSPVWQILDRLPAGELIPLEKELLAASQRILRDYRIKTLNGFLALDRNDPLRAMALWKEAEALVHTPLQMAYLRFLQARLTENQGKYENAGLQYSAIQTLTPGWLEPVYRYIVCQAKMGFADQALPRLIALIDQDPNFFNRILIDPEIERGRVQILTGLHPLWTFTEEQARNEVPNLERLRNDLGTWFAPDNKFALEAAERVDALLKMGGTHNFVPYQRVIKNRMALEKRMQEEITLEARDLRTRFKSYAQRLNRVTEEAAWFPFPRLLVEFNRSHNKISHSLTWALSTNLQMADNFSKAQTLADQQEVLLKKLESKIKFLRIVRDSTLFTFIMGKAFLWLEVAALVLIFVGLPLLLYYGEKADWPLVSRLLFQDKWEMQKALVLFTSIISLTIAGLRTAVVFEKRRDALLEKGRSEAMREFVSSRKLMDPNPQPGTPGQVYRGVGTTPPSEAASGGKR